LISKIRESDSIAIFGAGSYGAIISSSLISLGYNVKYFIDNDSRKWGQRKNENLVISPQSLLELYDETMQILVCSTWHKEIAQQLVSSGINNFVIYDFILHYQIYYKHVEQGGDLVNTFMKS